MAFLSEILQPLPRAVVIWGRSLTGQSQTTNKVRLVGTELAGSTFEGPLSFGNALHLISGLSMLSLRDFSTNPAKWYTYNLIMISNQS